MQSRRSCDLDISVSSMSVSVLRHALLGPCGQRPKRSPGGVVSPSGTHLTRLLGSMSARDRVLSPATGAGLGKAAYERGRRADRGVAHRAGAGGSRWRGTQVGTPGEAVPRRRVQDRSPGSAAATRSKPNSSAAPMPIPSRCSHAAGWSSEPGAGSYTTAASASTMNAIRPSPPGSYGLPKPGSSYTALPAQPPAHPR